MYGGMVPGPPSSMSGMNHMRRRHGEVLVAQRARHVRSRRSSARGRCKAKNAQTLEEKHGENHEEARVFCSMHVGLFGRP